MTCRWSLRLSKFVVASRRRMGKCCVGMDVMPVECDSKLCWIGRRNRWSGLLRRRSSRARTDRLGCVGRLQRIDAARLSACASGDPWQSRDGRGLPAYRASCTSSARTPIVSARRRPAERHCAVAPNRASCLARPGRLPTAQAAWPVPDRACCGELSLSPPRATWIPRPGCSAASEPTDASWPVAAGSCKPAGRWSLPTTRLCGLQIAAGRRPAGS